MNSPQWSQGEDNIQIPARLALQLYGRHRTENEAHSGAKAKTTFRFPPDLLYSYTEDTARKMKPTVEPRRRQPLDSRPTCSTVIRKIRNMKRVDLVPGKYDDIDMTMPA